MSGYIDNSVGDSLYSSYSQGRAFSGAAMNGLSNFAQWSAVGDAKTCDFCGWADMRIFDISIEPYDPPEHWGCRCLVAYIKEDEFPPTPDWGDGPPPSAFPPGIKNGMSKKGPTLRNAGKNKPPSRFKPEQIKKMLDKWKSIYKSKFNFDPTYGSYSGSKDVLTKFFEEYVWRLSADEKSTKLVSEFFSTWISGSPRPLKLFGEAAARGNADDLLKLITDLKGQHRYIAHLAEEIKTKEQAEAFLKAWDASKALTADILNETGLAKNGFIKVYRGVKPDYEFETIRKKLLAGDTDFAIGTNFVESWSTNVNVAKSFAGHNGMIFEKTVDVNEVLMSWAQNGQFLRYESEKEILWYNWDGTLVPKVVTKGTGASGEQIMVEVY